MSRLRPSLASVRAQARRPVAHLSQSPAPTFTGATAVTFMATPATSFTVVSSTSITATTPAHSAGSVNVSVTTPGGTGTKFGGPFNYVGAPTVTSVSPNSGPTAGGTSVTITGTNFNGATAVTFGGTAATGITVVNATSITATTPVGAVGAVDVAVTTPGGTGTGTGAFSYVASGTPTVTSVNPNFGPVAGGTSVTITGTNFTGATAVKFGVTAASSFAVNSATQITATSPAQRRRGRHHRDDTECHQRHRRRRPIYLCGGSPDGHQRQSEFRTDWRAAHP